jgi:hypothetical protein
MAQPGNINQPNVPGVQVKTAQYRQRVFQMPDGAIVLVFGDDPAPNDGVLLADHDVITVTTVSEHVEPTPVPTPIP